MKSQSKRELRLNSSIETPSTEPIYPLSPSKSVVVVQLDTFFAKPRISSPESFCVLSILI